MKVIPLHQHKFLKESNAPDFAGKVIKKAEMVEPDQKIRLYFTDGSYLSIGNFVEKVSDPELSNFAHFRISPGYCENVQAQRPDTKGGETVTDPTPEVSEERGNKAVSGSSAAPCSRHDSSYSREIKVCPNKVLIIDRWIYGEEDSKESILVIDRAQIEEALSAANSIE